MQLDQIGVIFFGLPVFFRAAMMLRGGFHLGYCLKMFLDQKLLFCKLILTRLLKQKLIVLEMSLVCLHLLYYFNYHRAQLNLAQLRRTPIAAFNFEVLAICQKF